MKRMLFSAFLLLALADARASHIAGGDFSYKWVSGNNFEFTLKFYRDCLNGIDEYDSVIAVAVFDKVTSALILTFNMHLQSYDTISTASPSSPCNIPPDVCIEKGIYTAIVSIPGNPNGYYVVWERCCRNANIVNIENPILTGMVFYLEMPDPDLHNSSPYFVYEPLQFACADNPLNYSFKATDIDGDQVVYEITDPLAGHTGYPYTGQPVTILTTPLPAPYVSTEWTPGYSLADICGFSTIPPTINSTTGNVSFTTGNIGTYLFAVVVKEYRNGVLIGLVRREIEFSVFVCMFGSIPWVNLSYTNTPLTSQTFEIIETDTLCFAVSAHDLEDSLWLTAESNVLSGGNISPPYATVTPGSGYQAAHSVFCWETGCGQSSAQPYYVTYSATDNGCPLPATVTFPLFIYLKPVPINSSLNILCMNFFQNDSAEIKWAGSENTVAKYFKSYEVYRSKNGGAFSLLSKVYDPNQDYYIDQAASDLANNTYCYCIRQVNTCDEAGEFSDTVCSDNPSYIHHIKHVTLDGDGNVKMEWKHFPDGPYSTFYIYRKENNSAAAFDLTETLYQPNYDVWVDKFVETSSKSYCYYLVNEDYCGNVSPQSNESCTILLEGKSEPYASVLNWNSYKGWNKVKQYEIYRKPVESANFSGLTIFPDSIFSYRDADLDLSSGQFRYYIKAIEDSGSLNGESISNEIELSQLPIGFLPSAFTPNDDGRNDVWNISSSFIKTIDLKVFNRWGSLVFATNDKNTLWNGTYKDKKAPQGTYIYTLKFSGYETADEFEQTGRVTIVR